MVLVVCVLMLIMCMLLIYSNDRVSVFTRHGQFVTSFGEGHITFPIGVSVDSDGFVYVCCYECVIQILVNLVLYEFFCALILSMYIEFF